MLVVEFVGYLMPAGKYYDGNYAKKMDSRRFLAD